ncbi:MAG TPA: hypothetical protein VNF47_02690 [Streptosporangiaceae bacterium]|nr:hypothetical protein [Streptosporangiaceae bacterium]
MAATAVAGAATLWPTTLTQAVAAPAPGIAVRSGPAGPSARAGLAGVPITLANHVQLSGYDAATDRSGRAYVGWIGDSGSGRRVYLCTLPRRATRCLGGIQSIGSLGASSAQGLRVLVTPAGQVTLVWFHDTVASVSGPEGGRVAIATSVSGGPLTAAHDVAPAQSFGSLLDAALAPNHGIWTVTGPSFGPTLQVTPGLGNSFVKVHGPYVAGAARLAFSGSTAVLAIQKDGAITMPVAYAFERNGAWSGFRTVARTWTSDANLGLATARSGIRLIATVNNANYFPVVSRWLGTAFSRPALTGDRNNCSPASHDTVADASGRLADASMECGDVAVANLTDSLHAAVVRFNVHGTFAGGPPQLTTSPSGLAWVAWSVESGSTGDRLLVARVLLPGRVVTASRTVSRNRVVVFGPASCLPPADIAVAVKGSPARFWRVVGKVLRLNGRRLNSTILHGGNLVPGARYTLRGSVTFVRGGARLTVTAALTFRSCPNP